MNNTKRQQDKNLILKISICTHIKSLSKKQVLQIIQKIAPVRCQTNHIKGQLIDQTICLHCNKIYCGLQSKQLCISTHQKLNQTHIFSYNLLTNNIYCSLCHQFINKQCQILIGENSNKKLLTQQNNEDLNKLVRFKQFINQTVNRMRQLMIQKKKSQQQIQKQRIQMSKAIKNYRGLYNIGNTCFLNTDLQVLNYSYKLRQIYKQYRISYSTNIGNKSLISYNNKSLVKQIQYFYDDVIEQGQSKIWHVVVNKKNVNRNEYEKNEKLIKTITNCKFNYLMQQFFKQMDIHFRNNNNNSNKNNNKNIQNNKNLSLSNKYNSQINESNNNNNNNNIQHELQQQQHIFPYSPNNILQYLSHIDNKYSLQQQQDAQQCLLFIIDILVQGQLVSMNYDLQRYEKVQRLLGKRKISPTQHIFGFYLTSQIYCQNCNKINYTLDLSYHLSINLQSKIDKSTITNNIKSHLSTIIQMNHKVYHKNIIYPDHNYLQNSNNNNTLNYNNNKKNTINNYNNTINNNNIINNQHKQQSNNQTKTQINQFVLPQFLYSFFQQQRLTHQYNYYSCTNCKSLVGFKKFYLLDLPHILIISIKRFNHQMIKNNKHISFQQSIDLKDVTLNTLNQDNQKQPIQTKFKLYAVIVHQGQTIHNGHYICFVKTNTNLWLKCSDQNINKSNLKQVLSQQAYILLYEKISNKQQLTYK